MPYAGYIAAAENFPLWFDKTVIWEKTPLDQTINNKKFKVIGLYASYGRQRSNPHHPQ